MISNSTNAKSLKEQLVDFTKLLLIVLCAPFVIAFVVFILIPVSLLLLVIGFIVFSFFLRQKTGRKVKWEFSKADDRIKKVADNADSDSSSEKVTYDYDFAYDSQKHKQYDYDIKAEEISSDKLHEEKP